MEASLSSSLGRTSLGISVVTIGRARDNGLVVSDPSVSSHHAETRPDGQGYSIFDLGSKNGTFVNGQRLAINTPRRLHTGDTIRMGDFIITYEEEYPSKLQPAEVARKLERAMEDSVLLQGEGRRLAPDVFDIFLSFKDHQQLLPVEATLKKGWQDHLIQVARQRHYTLRVMPVLRLHPSSDLRSGAVRIEAHLQDRQNALAGDETNPEAGPMATQALSAEQLAILRSHLPPGQQLPGLPDTHIQPGSSPDNSSSSTILPGGYSQRDEEEEEWKSSWQTPQAGGNPASQGNPNAPSQPPDNSPPQPGHDQYFIPPPAYGGPASQLPTNSPPLPAPVIPPPAYKAPAKSIGQVADVAAEDIDAVFPAISSPRKVHPRNLAQEHLQFTAFHPRMVPVETWNTLLVYTYIESALEAILADAAKYKDKLGANPGKAEAWASRRLARGTQITIVPTFQGVYFNPERITFTWQMDWYPTIFNFYADRRWAGAVGSGEITIFTGPLIIASLRVSLRFQEQTFQLQIGDRSNQEMVSISPYRKIFASYSHDDTPIVLEIRKASEVIGDQSLIDITNLRSGQNWSTSLLRLIDNSDIFQLFWSDRSANSFYVRQECEYALQHYKYDGFIRPVYWEKPMRPPPPELSHLQFAFYEIPQRNSFFSRFSSMFSRK